MRSKEGEMVGLVLERLLWRVWEEVPVSHGQLDLESRGEEEEDLR